MKIVIVHHLNDVTHYLFSVPENRELKKDDLVLVRNSRGETPAICVCDSFEVNANILSALQARYGGKTLKQVIGTGHFARWGADEENAIKGERLTEDFCVGGKHCWQVKDADNLMCGEVCEGREDEGCEGCPLATAINKLAAYENTGLSPEQIQKAVNLLNDSFYDADIPKELSSWVERCTWHVRKCNELHTELEKYRSLGSVEQLEEMKARLEGLEK